MLSVALAALKAPILTAYRCNKTWLMDAREELNRAKWASRRGLLELDLLLSPFVNDAFDALTDELKSDYRALLFNDDQDLMEWIMGRAQVPEQRFAPVVSAIRHFHGMGG